MKRAAFVLPFLLLAVPAAADVVVLRGGGEVRGEVVERRPDAVVLEVGPGRLTLPLSRVERIVTGSSPLSEYRARAAALSPLDARGWLSLGHWAASRSLLTQARESYERVLALDPANAEAHAGLGHVLVGGRWLPASEANRARGLVPFEGAWITPGERAGILDERAVAAIERQEAREADARARAAEAEARRAEADARRAEAEAAQVEQAGSEGGIPYPWVFDPSYGGAIVVPGGYGGVHPWPPLHGGRAGRHRPPADPPTVSPPPVRPHRPTRDEGARDDDRPAPKSAKRSVGGSR